MQRTVTPSEEPILNELSAEQTLSEEMQRLDNQNADLQREYQYALHGMTESRAQIVILTKQKAESLEQFALYDQQIEKLEIEIAKENQLATQINLREKISAKLRDSFPEFHSEKKTPPDVESAKEIADKLIIHRERYKNEFSQLVLEISDHQLKINALQAHAERLLIALEKNQERKKTIDVFIDAIKMGANELANDIDQLETRLNEMVLLSKQAETKQKRHIAFIASGWFKADATATQYLAEMRAAILNKISPMFQDINIAFQKKAFLMTQALICVNEDDIENKFQLHSLGAKLTTVAAALATLNMSVRANRAIKENVLPILAEKKRAQLDRANEMNKLTRHAITLSYLELLRQHDEHLAEQTCYLARLFCNRQKRNKYTNELRAALNAYDVHDTTTLYTRNDKQAIAQLKKVVGEGMKRYRPGFFSWGYSKTSHPTKHLHHILKLLDGQLCKLHGEDMPHLLSSRA